MNPSNLEENTNITKEVLDQFIKACNPENNKNLNSSMQKNEVFFNQILAHQKHESKNVNIPQKNFLELSTELADQIMQNANLFEKYMHELNGFVSYFQKFLNEKISGLLQNSLDLFCNKQIKGIEFLKNIQNESYLKCTDLEKYHLFISIINGFAIGLNDDLNNAIQNVVQSFTDNLDEFFQGLPNQIVNYLRTGPKNSDFMHANSIYYIFQRNKQNCEYDRQDSSNFNHVKNQQNEISAKNDLINKLTNNIGKLSQKCSELTANIAIKTKENEDAAFEICRLRGLNLELEETIHKKSKKIILLKEQHNRIDCEVFKHLGEDKSLLANTIMLSQEIFVKNNVICKLQNDLQKLGKRADNLQKKNVASRSEIEELQVKLKNLQNDNTNNLTPNPLLNNLRSSFSSDMEQCDTDDEMHKLNSEKLLE